MTDKRKKPIEDETDWIYVLQLPTSISSFFSPCFIILEGNLLILFAMEIVVGNQPYHERKLCLNLSFLLWIDTSYLDELIKMFC